MALRPIRIWPDSALHQKAKPFEQFDEQAQTLIRDLFDTMYKKNGVGLAATQIAVPMRALVIDLDPHGEAKSDPKLREELNAMGFLGPQALVNPKILKAESKLDWEEGCLSVPGIYETVTRKEYVEVEALDERGEPRVLQASNLFAVALQHEIDHLDGKVFVEYLSKLKRDLIRGKMGKYKAERTEIESKDSITS